MTTADECSSQEERAHAYQLRCTPVLGNLAGVVGLNNRAENSHQPTRRRERQMKCVKSAGQARRILWARAVINKLVPLRCDHLSAVQPRAARTRAFAIWAQVSGTSVAARQGLVCRPVQKAWLLAANKLTVPSRCGTLTWVAVRPPRREFAIA